MFVLCYYRLMVSSAADTTSLMSSLTCWMINAFDVISAHDTICNAKNGATQGLGAVLEELVVFMVYQGTVLLEMIPSSGGLSQ